MWKGFTALLIEFGCRFVLYNTLYYLCNPPNSDMAYRTFNACMCSFLCVCIRGGGGGGPPTCDYTQLFSLGKTHKFFLCSWRGGNYCFCLFFVVQNGNLSRGKFRSLFPEESQLQQRVALPTNMRISTTF